MTIRLRTSPSFPSGMRAGNTTAGRLPLLFSDVDDTLLDDRTPTSAVAAGWASLATRVEFVLASSRTLGELLYLLSELDTQADLIAENGTCIAVRSRSMARALGASETLTRAGRRWYIRYSGGPADRTLQMVVRVREQHGADIRLAGELPPARLTELLGDNRYRARLALTRRCTVLVEPPPPSAANAAWVQTLRQAGYRVALGGRWLSIWRGPDKGDAAQAYLAARRQIGRMPPQVAAVGDAANDRPLLTSVPGRFVVRRPAGRHDPALLAVPGAVPLAEAGNAGWRAAAALLLGERSSCTAEAS